MKKTIFIIVMMLTIATLFFSVTASAQAAITVRNSENLSSTNLKQLINKRLSRSFVKLNDSDEFISHYPAWLFSSYADLSTAMSNYSNITIVTKGRSSTFATLKEMDCTFFAPIYEIQNQKCLLGKDFLTMLYFINIVSPLSNSENLFPIEFSRGFIDANSLVENNSNFVLCVRNYNLVIKVDSPEEFYVPVFYSNNGEVLLFSGEYYTELMYRLPKNK